MRSILLALASALLATGALAIPARAQDAPRPPAGPLAGAELAPPPPGGPRGERPPPPPPGVVVMIDRGANGAVHVDVHCARADTTKDCADIASRLLASTSVVPGGNSGGK